MLQNRMVYPTHIILLPKKIQTTLILKQMSVYECQIQIIYGIFLNYSKPN